MDPQSSKLAHKPERKPFPFWDSLGASHFTLAISIARTGEVALLAFSDSIRVFLAEWVFQNYNLGDLAVAVEHFNKLPEVIRIWEPSIYNYLRRTSLGTANGSRILIRAMNGWEIIKLN